MSIKVFQQHFDPRKFVGSLARGYTDREDLFQQLIGAFLFDRFGSRVHVSPTKGQDGSIDIFIEEGADANETFFNLHFPIIVECKDHDDSLGTLTKNIAAGWMKVEEKLSRHAATGWKGTYQPWIRARGYLYCISAVLPHQAARDELASSISIYFNKLPADHPPAIDKSLPIDWSDLRHELNRCARLSDAWLGIDLEGVIGHKEYEAGLSGFREYLKEDHLTFINPPIDDPVHPNSLFTAIKQNAGIKGLLLVGAGGCGKTRTCFEVAKIAHHAGWRVLHIVPGGPQLSAQEIADVVFQGSCATLLVFDYIDQLLYLDLNNIRHRLMPGAKVRGITLALLANARPGALRRPNPERDSLFERVMLDLGTRRSSISDHLQRSIAPKATAILGAECVRELCGTRPIIEMFIAKELEQYAENGNLHYNDVSDLKSGDLQNWIRKRFQEDDLLPKDSDNLLPTNPDAIMISTAAGLAAAPLWQAKMINVIAHTLDACQVSEAAEKAPLIVRALLNSGWLEAEESVLVTPHDVVADELLEVILCDRARLMARPGMVDKVFSGSTVFPRVFGRYSVALDRVLGQEEFPAQLKDELMQSLSEWLKRNSATMGKSFIGASPDEVSYTFGAVITGAAWGEVALHNWDLLVAPWLSINCRDMSARHLLHRGLKELSGQVARTLIVVACEWLSVHKMTMEAGYVLAPLLARQDLEDNSEEVFVATIDWLAQYQTSFEAEFVLYELIARQDLGQRAGEAINAALAWLSQYKINMEAEFLLHALLARQDLGDKESSAIVVAGEWLSQYKITLDAGYVLTALLERQNLGSVTESVIKDALSWLAKFYDTKNAAYVTAKLLGSSPLSTTDRSVCLSFALLRLEKVMDSPEASLLLRNVLKERTLTGANKNKAIDCALRWLENHQESPEMDFVFKRLLRNPTIDGMVWRKIANFALKWLKRTPINQDRDHALNSLMARLSLLYDEEIDYLRKEATIWLKAYPDALGKERLIKCLKQLKHGPPTVRAKNANRAAKRMFISSDFLNKQALEKTVPEKAHIKEALRRANSLLKNNHPGSAAYLLAPLIPLSTRLGQKESSGRVLETVKLLLVHPDFTLAQRKGFERSIYILLDKGAWLDVREGEQLLCSIGLNRPRHNKSVASGSLRST